MKRKSAPRRKWRGANSASARNDCHFLNRPPRKNLNAGLGDVDHLFDTNALTLAIALLGLKSEVNKHIHEDIEKNMELVKTK